jgi:hypothetical protein
MQLDRTDVDGRINHQIGILDLIFDFSGAHIPDISSEEGFFNILHLGIFLILSPAFDKRFYESSKPPCVTEELEYALRHFLSILHEVIERFHILLDGVGMSVKYVLDRMLSEFAAAAAFLAKNLPGEEVGADIKCSTFIKRLEGIIQKSYPDVLGYYSCCLDHGYKYFVWTGPKLKMLPRLEGMVDVVPITELLDLPTYFIYDVVLDATLPLPHLSPPPLMLGKDWKQGMNQMKQEKSPRGENFRVGLGGFFFLWNLLYFYSLSSFIFGTVHL